GASRPRPRQPPRTPLVEPESVRVTSVRFDPPNLAPSGLLARTLGLKPPVWVSPRDLDERIAHVYATGVFENVRYRLENGELTVLLRERAAGRFGVGLRYDSRYKASVLLSSTVGRGAGGGGASGQGGVGVGQGPRGTGGAPHPAGGGRGVGPRAAPQFGGAPSALC